MLFAADVEEFLTGLLTDDSGFVSAFFVGDFAGVERDGFGAVAEVDLAVVAFGDLSVLLVDLASRAKKQ